MDESTKEKILKLLEGIPPERQVKILKAAKVMARLRASEAKASSLAGDHRKERGAEQARPRSKAQEKLAKP